MAFPEDSKELMADIEMDYRAALRTFGTDLQGHKI